MRLLLGTSFLIDVFFVLTQIQDERLLTSVRLSERILLWNKFSGPVDPHAIKVDFLKKVHRTNPPLRRKCHPVSRHRPVKVGGLNRCLWVVFYLQ